MRPAVDDAHHQTADRRANGRHERNERNERNEAGDGEGGCGGDDGYDYGDGYYVEGDAEDSIDIGRRSAGAVPARPGRPGRLP